MVKPLDIAVLMGGVSSEREISLRSGTAVARALSRRGHRVRPVDIRTETGAELDGIECDVVFIALHGRFGEDGGLQRLLEARGIPYPGSDPEASWTAMDKVEAKRLFQTHHLETPPHRVIAEGDPPELLEQCARALGYPVVIKPRSEGSSVGVTIHHDRSTLGAGAAAAHRHGSFALMEKFIEGREMTVAILDERPLPIIEVRPAQGFFTWAAKYQDARTGYVVDPPMGEQDREAVRRTALGAHRALGCRGFSRVDVIFTPLRSVHVLEVNTIPGLTERSLLPKAAQAAGLEYDELCERIVLSALRTRAVGSGLWAAAL